VKQVNGKRASDYCFDRSAMVFGYLTLTVTPKQRPVVFTEVNQQGIKSQFDKKISGGFSYP